MLPTLELKKDVYVWRREKKRLSTTITTLAGSW
jgi:hypothetical protein